MITIGAETILRASLLAIMVFGLFAYPSEILPIKVAAITCLGLLSNFFALNGEAIKREASNHFNILAKLSLTGLILLICVGAYTRTNKLKLAYTTWNDAFEIYNYGLYQESLEDYKKAYPVLKHNGEYLINYGKALSIAGKHSEAVTILKQARSYQGNSILYTALGDSYKALEKYNNAEQQYSQAASIAPAKFYPLYLLAKLYDASGQQHNAIAMANTIIEKEVKVHSTAIDEIKEEMKTIIAKYKKGKQTMNNTSLLIKHQFW